MKKHLIAAAVAAAVAAPARAQNVSIYGVLDTSVARMNDVAAAGQSATVIADGAISSSVWGLRGTEDLGGGLKAVFQLEGDVQTNNGGTNQNGIFRRAAYAGVGGGFGEITLGTRLNPIIATNGALMPVAGNSVSTLSATALAFPDFYTKNSITYTTPTVSGVTGQFQYGFGNSVAAATPGGSVTAGSLTYVAGPLELRAAGQKRKENGDASSANAAVAPNATQAVAAFESSAYVVGVKYKLGDWTLAYALLSNNEANALLSAGGVKTKRDANQVGVGYQMSPAVLLGASYTESEGSNLTNIQARYSLSKRTTGYAMYGVSDNGVLGRVNFLPYATNTGSFPAANIGGAAAAANLRSSGLGVGLIHTF